MVNDDLPILAFRECLVPSDLYKARFEMSCGKFEVFGDACRRVTESFKSFAAESRDEDAEIAE